MVHPTSGERTRIHAADRADRLGAEIGLERLELSARDGMGLETFYRRFGFVEWGRRPGWIRVAADDDRDEIFYWLDLRSPGPGESG